MCMLTESNALLMSSATVIVHSGSLLLSTRSLPVSWEESVFPVLLETTHAVCLGG